MKKSICKKCIIFCGGRGTRLGELGVIPKPMVLIGDKPIVYRIMEHYAKFGIKDFVLCVGYKGDMITNYFNKNTPKGWTVNCLDTGEDSNTAERLYRALKIIKDKYVHITYGDGISDVDISLLQKYFFFDQQNNNSKGIITIVHPQTRFGIVNIDGFRKIINFEEKPIMKEWINGGFMILDVKHTKKILKTINYKGKDIAYSLLPVMAKQLSTFPHYGVWKCMDTYKDYVELNKWWNSYGFKK